MASSVFTINGGDPSGGVAVAGSSTVNLALVSSTGVNSVAWSFQGNHSSSATNPTITPGDTKGLTASFTMPAGAGQCYLLECKVNGSLDEDGEFDAALTRYAVVGVNTAGGGLPFASNEEYARSATHGWTERLNEVSAVSDSATPTTQYTMPYALTSSRMGWSTQLWTDGTYLGIGVAGTLPATGAIRLAADTAIYWADNVGNELRGLAHYYSGGKNRLQVGEPTDVDILELYTAESIFCNDKPIINVSSLAVGNDGTDPNSGLLRLNAYNADLPLIQLSDYYGTSVGVIQAGHNAGTGNPTFEVFHSNAEVTFKGVSFDCDETPLRGFYSGLSALDGSADVAIPADSAPHTVATYTFEGSANDVIAIETRMWASSGTAANQKHIYNATVYLQYGSGGAAVIIGTDTSTVNALAGMTASYLATAANAFQVQLTSTATACFGAAAEFWDQKPRTITSA